MNDKTITINVELPESDATALAQFCKRVGWSEFRQNASSDEEAYSIQSGTGALQEALARRGFNPR